MKNMRHILLAIFTLISAASIAQQGAATNTVFYSSVDGTPADTTQSAFTNAIAAKVAQGYGYAFFNSQATTPHWDFYTDGGVQHVFTFSGSGTVSDWGDIGGTLSDQTDLQSALDAKVNDTGNETIGGIKTFSSDPLIPDEAYDATNWNGVLEPPTKNAVRDKIESLTTTVGTHDLFVSAVAMWPRVTNGSSQITRTEVATSLFNVQSLDFDQSADEFAQCQVVLPRSWNNGTVTAVVYWTTSASSGDVIWTISGGAYSNDDPLSTALGSAQSVTDTFLAANDLHVTSATSSITLAGTPQDADFLAIQISRDADNGSDTLNGDAKLLGISLRLTTDAETDN